MFTNILIPVDGSPISAKAATAGVAFAKQVGAKITVYSAVNPVPYGFHAAFLDASYDRGEVVVGENQVAGFACDVRTYTAISR